MVRTQLYLTERERDELASLARATGRKQSELIREAIDRYLRETAGDRRDVVLQRAEGMWRDRGDLPDPHALRRQWDRSDDDG